MPAAWILPRNAGRTGFPTFGVGSGRHPADALPLAAPHRLREYDPPIDAKFRAGAGRPPHLWYDAASGDGDARMTAPSRATGIRA